MIYETLEIAIACNTLPGIRMLPLSKKSFSYWQLHLYNYFKLEYNVTIIESIEIPYNLPVKEKVIQDFLNDMMKFKITILKAKYVKYFKFK